MGTVANTLTPVQSLVDMVHTEQIKLPEIQRPYIWRRPQVRDLLDSLYRRYPVGTVLIWESSDLPYARPLDGANGNGTTDTTSFLLDGQQRLTSLEGVIKHGDPDIRFNFEAEEFEVANAAIRRDPRWVPIFDVFKDGAITVALRRGLVQRPDAEEILRRLNRLEQIRAYAMTVHILRDFDYGEVTDIFVRVNQKGTRLREAELAIARLALRLPGLLTDQLRKSEDELEREGYDIDLRFLVRCLTAVTTGQSRFGPLGAVTPGAINTGWDDTKRGLTHLLNLLKQNLGVESTDWIPSMNALVVPVSYLGKPGIGPLDPRRLLQWFLLASMWQRYAGSAETVLDQDLRALNQPSPFDVLIQQIGRSVGRLNVTPEDLDDAGVQSPFFLAMYLACRLHGAVDWWTGVNLSSTNLGTAHLLELHHVFPRALVSHRYPQADVNELANIAFLSQVAHRPIGATEPRQYLSTIPEDRLRQQFIPLEPELWELDNFQAFLSARRELLASGMNEVIHGLD